MDVLGTMDFDINLRLPVYLDVDVAENEVSVLVYTSLISIVMVENVSSLLIHQVKVLQVVSATVEVPNMVLHFTIGEDANGDLDVFTIDPVINNGDVSN